MPVGIISFQGRRQAAKSEISVDFWSPFGLLLGVPGASFRHQISKKAFPEPIFGDFFADSKKASKTELPGEGKIGVWTMPAYVS